MGLRSIAPTLTALPKGGKRSGFQENGRKFLPNIAKSTATSYLLSLLPLFFVLSVLSFSPFSTQIYSRKLSF